jgi:hypothetical protein
MHSFLLNLGRFVLFCIAIIFLIIILPATPKSSNSLLFISKNKEVLLQKTETPRIIFLGGSNLSFGLDSKLLKDSLFKNPVNMGIHASLGLKYMMSQYLKYAKKGDVVVLVPEYQQYVGDFSEGTDGEELARIVFDVDINNFFLLNMNQRVQIFSNLPNILKSRLSFDEYLGYEFDFIYSRYVYNEFGDVDTKYLIQKRSFEPQESLNNANINYKLIGDIIQFKNNLKMKGIKLYISFPGYQDTSFNNSKNKIKQIHSILIKNNFEILGKPEVFSMEHKLMLNSPYHLNKNGVNRRTMLLINFLKHTDRNF